MELANAKKCVQVLWLIGTVAIVIFKMKYQKRLPDISRFTLTKVLANVSTIIFILKFEIDKFRYNTG